MELRFKIAVSDKHFEKLVKKALKEIPKEFQDKIENVDIVIQDYPNQYQLNKLRIRGEKNYLLGLYEGTPKTKRGRYSFVLPDKISIFKSNIEKIARTDKDLIEVVKNTVWHEIAHHLGLSEEEIRNAERKRRERRANINK